MKDSCFSVQTDTKADAKLQATAGDKEKNLSLCRLSHFLLDSVSARMRESKGLRKPHHRPNKFSSEYWCLNTKHKRRLLFHQKTTTRCTSFIWNQNGLGFLWRMPRCAVPVAPTPLLPSLRPDAPSPSPSHGGYEKHILGITLSLTRALAPAARRIKCE